MDNEAALKTRLEELADELREVQGDNDDLQVSIEDLDIELLKARNERDMLEGELYATQESLETARAAEGLDPQKLTEAFQKIMSGLREVLPEGEDVVDESIEVFNLRRGLEEIVGLLDPNGKERWPWSTKA